MKEQTKHEQAVARRDALWTEATIEMLARTSAQRSPGQSKVRVLISGK